MATFSGRICRFIDAVMDFIEEVNLGFTRKRAGAKLQGAIVAQLQIALFQKHNTPPCKGGVRIRK